MQADLEKLRQLITPATEAEAWASIRAYELGIDVEALQTFAAISAPENRDHFSAEAAQTAFAHIKPQP